MSLDEYIEQHCSEEGEVLRFIEHDTNVNVLNPHMLTGKVEGRLLSLLSQMIRPRRILELGTFTGYSALCLAEGLKGGEAERHRGGEGKVVTIEHNDEQEETIRHNLSLSPLGERIELRMGDALETLKRMQAEGEEKFDLCFIDADKRQYSEYLEAVLPLMNDNSWILADNTLWDGHVIDPAYDKDKQTLGLRAFNDKVMAMGLESAIVPIRDGLTIIKIWKNN